MTPGRVRLALCLVSAAAIGLELALMRTLALRWWHHLASLAVGVALLGFGASGTALSLARSRITGLETTLLAACALAFAAAIPIAHRAASHVPLNVHYLSWNLGQAGYVLALEMILFIPFLLAGGAIGVALTDRPDRIAGHYAANLMGSGLGGIAAVLLMHELSPDGLIGSMTLVALLGGAAALPWRRSGPSGVALAASSILSAAAWAIPPGPDVSEYKTLPQALAAPGSRTIYQAEGPLGRIDVVEGPALHQAPGLGLRWTSPLPAQTLLIVDGDSSSPVYACTKRTDWAFMDHTTKAAPYHLLEHSAVLVVGAGGGSDMGLALYHETSRIVALETNPQVIAAMTGPLAGRGGAIYAAPCVRVVLAEARGFLAGSRETFDVIQLPESAAFNSAEAGLHAAQESYLHTVEAYGAMLDRLSEGGALCITQWAQTPPRAALRTLDAMAEALRRRGAQPSLHLAMIRNWATASAIAFRRPIGPDKTARLRAFCAGRGFDLCTLPDLRPDEVNRFHLLDRPYYYEGALALLGPRRDAFLAEYPFHIEAATDDRPYFFHFFRWRSLPMPREQLGHRLRAFLESGHLLLIVTLLQTVALSAMLIVLPLAPRIAGLRAARNKAVVLGYFLAIGVGFMLLEMNFLQKLILYLAHPVYTAAVVFSSFLVFGGAGSLLSGRCRIHPRSAAVTAGLIVASAAAASFLLLDGWLSLTQGASIGIRFLVASATIAPLAMAMGHLLPCGLRAIGTTESALVPWAWAVNGFGSVTATMAAPLLAMQAGFSRVALAAAACYALAALLARWLPIDSRRR
jgi:hypothetical protein